MMSVSEKKNFSLGVGDEKIGGWFKTGEKTYADT
jgi:hypothetical protein